ncbi:MAG TPA: radical SAM/Cys-rich domain protein [Planctomycetes bacterium]|nr:radical SAM/Cys-rich domain protein [Planctomycetota bacterium]
MSREKLVTDSFPVLQRETVQTVQVNLGKLCNQVCKHCHVEAGPNRTEIMTAATASRILQLVEASPNVTTIDLTGGAPEMNPEFRRVVRGLRALGRSVLVRSNLTVLQLPDQRDTIEFFAEQGVSVVASLPCYLEENVDAQRGTGVFEESIEALRRLNGAGFGSGRFDLDLVFNPQGADLPPPQASLEAAYKKALLERHGIRFDRLLTITNMPIARFRESLARQGLLDLYLDRLVRAHRATNLDAVMCRSLVSVSWDGRLYDCDFNQMLEVPLQAAATLDDIESFGDLDRTVIATAPHCFGCTAGAGSSCRGALTPS